MKKQPIFDENAFDTTSVEVDVSAKNCLYFAWAPPGFRGPENWSVGGWEEGDDYRPQYVSVKGYDEVHIRADDQKYWRHGALPEYRSKADGRDLSVKTDCRYQSDAYYSRFIEQDHDIRLNGLVAMIGGDLQNPPNEANPSKVQYVGLCNKLEIPPWGVGDQLLYLGMHDGFEWSTNSNDDGPIAVTITLAKLRKR